MATKVVYFIVDGNKEQAEFRSDDSRDDLKETFRAAAEAGPEDILKLYNKKGNLLNISPKLTENTPDTRYTLEVVATHCNVFFPEAQKGSHLGVDISMIESRLGQLETRVYVDNGELPAIVKDLKIKVEQFKEKLESVDHLSWLGLTKDISCGTSLKPFWDKSQSHRKTEQHSRLVFEKFRKMSFVQVTDEVRGYLRKPTFDNWQWDDPEMLILLRQMYIDLGFISKFNIEMPVLHQWLYEVYKNYNNVPFHNFKHCFMVTQMMYGLTWLIDTPSLLDDLDILILITSAICHDLDHPGYNNAYQVNAKTELALRYNDISPLENHHCSVAFEILEKHNCNIFRNLPKEQFRKVREGMIRCILGTDMAKHNEILINFRAINNTTKFDFQNKEHKSLLLMILIKVADISNECRPMDVAEPWLECLLQEFFNQSDVEKLEGLPVAPFMDREKVNKSSSQIGFIKYALLPLFESLGELFPVIEEDIIKPVRTALDYYTEMHRALEEEKKKRESVGDMSKQNGITQPSQNKVSA
ncbi:high affinity cGMP-specific 3',5'-cyclic phosphodiesterase 9A-like isoform X1 [Mizuhopecten yessoensis]|uniref:high affinity cGMP-specific 3',5'-cyclic phosphodiesterase 9A-like isoform X1 n=1 Tax=Mizuhopecten yessoensis TaxID=6573 RepID=UPI000B45C938|nr:high affinity cGMP-specific 3',5'-cyclic phosphodiesterase 9A-like isoform X1 [Mizuhopecten yessoensis]